MLKNEASFADKAYNKQREFKKRPDKEENEITISNQIIDKLKVIVEIKNQREIDDVVNVLLTIFPSNKIKKTIKEKPSHIYPVQFVLEIPSNDPKDPSTTVWIGICPISGKCCVIYCPAKVSNIAFTLMDSEVFSLTCFGSFYNFISGGVVKRIDVCLNLFNVNVEDYLFRGNWFKHYGCFFGSGGHLETIYWGLVGGGRAVIYNKKKEDSTNYTGYSHVTRVERQIKSPNILVSDLHKLENPFSRVEIYTLDLSRIDFIPSSFLTCFLDSCRARGFSNALRSLELPENLEKKALRQLKEEPWAIWLEAQENWSTNWIETLENYRLREVQPITGYD